MLDLADPRWRELHGGYRGPFDARPLLTALRAGDQLQAVWDSLWQELYHQGDIGQASFAVIPHMVAIHRARGTPDFNVYAFAGSVELARGRGGNPEPAPFLAQAYNASLRQLAEHGLTELRGAKSPELVRSILGLVALTNGLRSYGEVLIEFTEDEVAELRRATFGDEGGTHGRAG